MRADWAAIQTDYAAGSSYRTLAARYGVNKDTIMRRAQKEKWADTRKTYSDNLRTLSVQKTAEAVASAEAERAIVLSSISTKAARFLDERLDELIGSGAKAYEIKAIMETARIIRDMDKDSTHADDDPLMKYLEEMRNA